METRRSKSESSAMMATSVLPVQPSQHATRYPSPHRFDSPLELLTSSRLRVANSFTQLSAFQNTSAPTAMQLLYSASRPSSTSSVMANDGERDDDDDEDDDAAFGSYDYEVRQCAAQTKRRDV